jgi:hypothetical protein
MGRMQLQWTLANYGRRFPLIQAGDVCRSIHGVYLVYHDGNPERPLLIGDGNICEHLRAISRDPDLMICSVLGMLRATWAAVPERYVEGVKNFLVGQLDPIIRLSLGFAAPIPVNLPREKPL